MRRFARCRRQVSPDTDPNGNRLLAKLIDEISAQRRLQEAQLAMNERRDRLNRRWRYVAGSIVIFAPVLLSIAMYSTATGARFGPFGRVTGIIHINGEISATSNASAARIIPTLQQAFEDKNVERIVLSIDSPGGAPVEAERICSAITALRTRYPKPITAAINNIGASAAYMVALHTDKIIAGKYSLVGSIGAVMAPWQLERAMGKLGVSQRVYASGKLKAFLNPFTPVSPEADSKAQELVARAGADFHAAFFERRKAKLKPGIDYATGEVWGGMTALELGLVDEIGTVEDIVLSSKVKTYDFGPHTGGSIFGSALLGALSTHLKGDDIQTPKLR